MVRVELLERNGNNEKEIDVFYRSICYESLSSS